MYLVNNPTEDKEKVLFDKIQKGVQQNNLQCLEENDFDKQVLNYEELINKGNKEYITKEEYELLQKSKEDILSMEPFVVKDHLNNRKRLYVKDISNIQKAEEVKGFFGTMSIHPEDINILKGISEGDNINFTDAKGDTYKIIKKSNNQFSVIDSRGFCDHVSL